jgi:hypothetical protein
MTIKIRIFSSFCESANCKKTFERLCETSKMSNYGPDKDIYITNDDDYTHVIILNTAMPVLKNIPKQNVVGLAFEPPIFLGLSLDFVEYAEKYIGKYFIGEKYDLPSPFIENYSYMWYTTPLTYIPIKTKRMSIMVSEKNDAPGHKYRHMLVQRILSQNLPIDIYGRGCEKYNYLNSNTNSSNQNSIFPFLLKKQTKDPRLKGKFEDIEPYESYDFHICIENFSTNEYFSEKITSTLLCGTTPIYWGCKNIDSYFPDSFIKLTGSIDSDILLLTNILKNPEEYKKNIDIDLVKDKINILKHLDDIFE